MFKKMFLVVVLSLFTTTSVLAQTWEKSEEADDHSSIVKIAGDGYSGSGTVIEFIEDSKKYEGYYIGYILTASHVIADRDIALIRALIPDDIKPMEISKDPVPIEAEVELCGYGTGQLRHWKAKYGGSVMNDGGHIVFSWAIQGDSGGPIIYKGKVVGVICFGMAIKRYKETNRTIVGPIYGSNVGKLTYKKEEESKPEDKNPEGNGSTVSSPA